ncbi:hypothetical protein LCGC14_1104340 [marine sediment metagenome]|uniref:Uncharacterized protein n=1 Tax=marine sediment metagenome TaxID=412755 RepID=A0A0F9PRT6_9ZZZZ
MPKPKRMKKAKSESKNAEKLTPPIPMSAVPHLFNEKMLQWQDAQFQALKSVYDKLDEILAVLKE